MNEAAVRKIALVLTALGLMIVGSFGRSFFPLSLCFMVYGVGCMLWGAILYSHFHRPLTTGDTSE